MAKTKPTPYYSLFSWDSLSEFANLSILRMVIKNYAGREAGGDSEASPQKRSQGLVSMPI